MHFFFGAPEGISSSLCGALGFGSILWLQLISCHKKAFSTHFLTTSAVQQRQQWRMWPAFAAFCGPKALAFAMATAAIKRGS